MALPFAMAFAIASGGQTGGRDLCLRNCSCRLHFKPKRRWEVHEAGEYSYRQSFSIPSGDVVASKGRCLGFCPTS